MVANYKVLMFERGFFMTIVGIRRVDLDRDGSSIHGYQLHCIDEDVHIDQGDAVDKFFVSDRLCLDCAYSPSLGDQILPIYPKESKRIKTIIRLDNPTDKHHK